MLTVSKSNDLIHIESHEYFVLDLCQVNCFKINGSLTLNNQMNNVFFFKNLRQ